MINASKETTIIPKESKRVKPLPERIKYIIIQEHKISIEIMIFLFIFATSITKYII